VIWQCNDKYRKAVREHGVNDSSQGVHERQGDERCRIPHVTEEQVQLAFLQQFNALFGQKDEVLWFSLVDHVRVSSPP
jgi:hypothetical protein